MMSACPWLLESPSAEAPHSNLCDTSSYAAVTSTNTSAPAKFSSRTNDTVCWQITWGVLMLSQ
eukprot:3125182-Amphidinium_carterae.1